LLTAFAAQTPERTGVGDAWAVAAISHAASPHVKVIARWAVDDWRPEGRFLKTRVLFHSATVRFNVARITTGIARLSLAL
jgi:hypothetical protein